MEIATTRENAAPSLAAVRISWEKVEAKIRCCSASVRRWRPDVVSDATTFAAGGSRGYAL